MAKCCGNVKNILILSLEENNDPIKWKFSHINVLDIFRFILLLLLLFIFILRKNVSKNVKESIILKSTEKNFYQVQKIELINCDWFEIPHTARRNFLQKCTVMAISCHEITFDISVSSSSFGFLSNFWETLWSHFYYEYSSWKMAEFYIFHIFLTNSLNILSYLDDNFISDKCCH